FHGRGDFVVGEALLENRFHALREEGEEIRLHLRVAGGEIDETVDADLHFALVAIEKDEDDALRGAAQREGILRAGRFRADREETGERIDAVGERHERTAERARKRVVEARRLVLIVDRLPDGLGISLFPRVDAADLALQIRELLHHFGDEVGLAEARGGQRIFVAAKVADDALDALRLLRIVAELLLELEMLELFEAIGELPLAIRLVEELGVRK